MYKVCTPQLDKIYLCKPRARAELAMQQYPLLVGLCTTMIHKQRPPAHISPNFSFLIVLPKQMNQPNLESVTYITYELVIL